jgi:muramoyltetrapeptide carboxypeptidase
MDQHSVSGCAGTGIIMVKHESYRWSPLKPGDIIDIVAPGSATPEDDLVHVIQFLKGAGFTPRVPSDLIAPELFCSNSDENRARHLITAFHDPKSKAIWCLRNGYGSNRIMPYLSKVTPPKRVKLFMGASDATPIHTFVTQQWKWPTLWCPALDKIANDTSSPNTRKEVGMVLTGKTNEITFHNLRPLNPEAQFSNEYQGPIIGGSLSSLCAGIATPWQLEGKDYILMIEEAGLRGTRLDQHLEHLYQIGMFKRATAVVFGSFYKCVESDGSNLWPSVLERIAKKCEIPFVFGIPTSNTGGDRPVPLGTPVSLFTGAINKLVCAVNGSVAGENSFSSISKVG